MGFIINPGDEIVFTRRRRKTEKRVNEETGVASDVEVVEVTEFGCVRSPEHLELTGGGTDTEWDEDKHILHVKWTCA